MWASCSAVRYFPSCSAALALAGRDFAEPMHAFPGHVPIFLPDDYTTHLRRLKQEHSAELSALLKPLEQLSLSERDAVGAAGIARAAALAWEANGGVIAALLPREVPRTLALPAPGIADWMLPEPPPDGVGMYDSVPQAVKHASIHVSHAPGLALGCRVREHSRPLGLRVQPATAAESLSIPTAGDAATGPPGARLECRRRGGAPMRSRGVATLSLAQAQAQGWTHLCAVRRLAPRRTAPCCMH